MTMKTKKGKTGSATKYLTRNQAIRKLQVRLSEFRRLCILKGIHPRDPKRRPKGPNKTYYHTKDIMYLMHEPLLKTFREISTHKRKVKRAKAKLNHDLAKRLLSRKPEYRLDHLVKERYPSFVDALRDLDDALTMVHLFATLPMEQRRAIPESAVLVSRRLALEWQAYVVRTRALRKAFIAVKGFYYQAEVLGQAVTWLVPHQLAQVIPADVDFRVMATFLEFYQTLLQFVNFRLFHLLGAPYPPVVDPRMEAAAAGLAALMQDLAEPSAPALATAGSEAPLDPAAAKRLEGLQDRLREMQAQGAAEFAAAAAPQPAEPVTTAAAAAAAAAAGQAEASDSGSDAAPVEIDSGSEGSEAGEEAAGAEAAPAAAREQSGADAGALVPAADGGGQAASALVGGAAAGEDDAEVCASLFKGLVFFLGREVPREQLLVVIRAFGGAVGWEGEGSPLQEADASITHQVSDRPGGATPRPGREVVQPQWLVDSANFRVLADAGLYAPGKAPPPHLSPFVSDEDEGYVPEYGAVLRRMQESARAIRRRAQGLAVEAAFLEEPQEAAAAAAGAGGEADARVAEAQFAAELSRELREGKRKAEAGAEEGDSDAEAAAAAPADATAGSASVEPADEEVMQKATMSRKDRNLYQSILNRQKAKRQRVRGLEAKRAALQHEAQA